MLSKVKTKNITFKILFNNDRMPANLTLSYFQGQCGQTLHSKHGRSVEEELQITREQVLTITTLKYFYTNHRGFDISINNLGSSFRFI